MLVVLVYTNFCAKMSSENLNIFILNYKLAVNKKIIITKNH